MNPYPLLLTCPKGLELLLADEAAALGLTDATAGKASVTGTGDLETAYRLCLWSRLANRVLLVLSEYDAVDSEALYQGIRAIDWDEHLDVSGSLAVGFSGKGCGIDNTHFGTLKVKDAIVDHYREVHLRRPNIDKLNPDLRVHVHAERRRASVSIDLSGGSLHRRGYRSQQGAAPLKENLAAAILIRAGWPQMAAEGRALTDPMCGSGTLLIEAAMMATDTAPNLQRAHWGFDGWLGHVPALWKRLHREAGKRAEIGRQKKPLWVRGYEADPRLVQPARNNVARAGLEDWIKVYQRELHDFAPSPDGGQTGLVVCNPPYGERLGEADQLLYLYQNLGRQLREQCPGWEAAVFTGNPELGKRMGIRSHKQYALYNGALPCKLILLHLVQAQFVTDKSPSSDAKSTEAASDTRLTEGAEMFANRLKKNQKKLKKWLGKTGIECYRLYDADMPEYAVAIDVYGEHLHVQEYAPPKSIDPARAEARMLDILSALPRALDIPRENIHLKRRERQRGKSQYRRQDRKNELIEVQEHGARLLVNLDDYLDTGLFLDHRPMRRRIQAEARGTRFLNLFCYTATATVHAALGGARTTTSVDLSNTYLDWGRKNLALNGFSEKHQLVRADVMDWIRTDRGEYDLIFIDPPTFSNSKRTEDVFDIQRDHPILIQAAMARLAPGGTLYFSNNFRRFEMEDDLDALYDIEEISRDTFDPDFERHKKNHRTWRIGHSG
ncbi:MAG: bifunctional 23S rRNA (guanine(2069)-N(7))-methyltransferase RlmK/23S rRNA (guanine(2445)-N(2))-methyltransferase RlmL [Pseudomonadota bacterium]